MEFKSGWLKAQERYRQQEPMERTDWFFRNLVPQSRALNMVFRRRLLEFGFESPDQGRELAAVCAIDPWFYFSSFGWTINKKEESKQPIQPMILYPYQNRAVGQILDSVGHNDIALPKSRDMGASWTCLLCLEWLWHFREDQGFLLTSEKEELVEGSNEKALFAKLDFWWRHLPAFLKPDMTRTQKHCKNNDTGSTFDGEATVENMATGDRKTAILMDETSKMRGASKIFTSTRDVTNCRIFNSTPNGRTGSGESFYLKVKNPATSCVFMHWTEHPKKRKGLYAVRETRGPDGEQLRERVELDDSYNWRDHYDFQQLHFAGLKPRSPWYDRQCDRAESKREIAQELDIDFVGSGYRAACDEATEAIRLTVQEPWLRGSVSVDPEDQSLYWMTIPDGPVALWCHLQDGRPPRGRYLVGIDVSGGTGGEWSSESSIEVFDESTGHQVMCFGSNTVLPNAWADIAMGVSKWFWDALLIPEVNGTAGTQFTNRLTEVGYANIWRREVKHHFFAKTSGKIGIFSEGAETLLIPLQEAAASGKMVVRSHVLFDQIRQYEYVGGKMVHQSSLASDGLGVRSHGDRAIGAGCVAVAILKNSAQIDVEEVPDDEPPEDSVEWRRRLHEQAQQYDEFTEGNFSRRDLELMESSGLI